MPIDSSTSTGVVSNSASVAAPIAPPIGIGDFVEDDSVDTSEDPEIQFGPLEGSGASSLSVTLPLEYEPLGHSTPSHDILPDQLSSYYMTINRGDCLNQLTKEFSNPELLNMDIIVRRRGTNGVVEAGVGSGVMKDCVSEFWEEFYSRYTVGNEVKVPFIRHDVLEDDWKSHGRILLYGRKQFGYLPIKLAPVIIEAALYDRAYSDLKETFLRFVDPVEHKLLTDALTDFDSTNMDDLLDVLENHQCRRRVTASNIETVIREIAHKELIQAPKFVMRLLEECSGSYGAS